MIIRDIRPYNYYTPLAGMFIGFEHYTHAYKIDSVTLSKTESYPSVDYIVQGYSDSTTLSKSESRPHIRKFVNNPRKYTQSTPIYYYDKDENFKLMLSDNTVRYTNGKIYDELNTTSELKFDIIGKHADIRYIQNEGRAVTTDNEGNFREFIVRTVEDIHGDNGSVKEVFAEGSEYELIDEWLPSYVQTSVDLPTALGAILQGTRFEVGEIQDKYSVQPVELKFMSKRKAVNELIKQWKGEVRYRVETDGERITRRYIDVLEPSKEPISKTYLSGRDVKTASRKTDSMPVKTAMYGVGAADENGNRLTFADVEWKVENGDPIDKPLGQAWVGDPEAMERWGANGGTKHKTGGYDGQEEDPAELLLNTWNHLQEQLNIRNTYEVDVINLGEILGLNHDRVSIGDRVNVQVSEVQPPIETEASVVGYEHDLNDRRKSKAIIGQFRNELNTEERLDNLEKDWNDSKGELEKKPDKIKNELEGIIDEGLSETQERIDEANEAIEQAKKELNDSMDRIERTKASISDVQDEIDSARSRPQDYVGFFDGDIYADNLTLGNRVIAQNAVFTGTVQGSNLTFLRGDFEKVNVIDANIQNANITGTLNGVDGRFTGRLDGVDGNFVGTVTAENIQGRRISGVTFETGTSYDKHTWMRDQQIRFYEGNTIKMRLGFREGNYYEPYLVMGKGKSDGTSVFYLEKNENDISYSYSTSEGYSVLRMNHNGSTTLSSAGSYTYLQADYAINSNVKMQAPEFEKSSTVKIKDNIRKYDGDALGVLMDTDIWSYHLKNDLENGIYDNEQIGFLAEASPMLKSGDFISLDRAVAYNWAATRQQQNEIETLCKRIEDLETMMEAI